MQFFLIVFIYPHTYFLSDKVSQIFENYSLTYTMVKPVGSIICYRLHHFIFAGTQMISLLLIYMVKVSILLASSSPAIKRRQSPDLASCFPKSELVSGLKHRQVPKPENTGKLVYPEDYRNSKLR